MRIGGPNFARERVVRVIRLSGRCRLRSWRGCGPVRGPVLPRYLDTLALNGCQPGCCKRLVPYPPICLGNVRNRQDYRAWVEVNGSPEGADSKHSSHEVYGNVVGLRLIVRGIRAHLSYP